mmetsp:Transcript_10688/g.23165  ORF Transcript_10688/g.23165 Transcript_10688/m.23165 type:complete len:122 (+) Transcript_10688:850-1215(+)
MMNYGVVEVEVIDCWARAQMLQYSLRGTSMNKLRVEVRQTSGKHARLWLTVSWSALVMLLYLIPECEVVHVRRESTPLLEGEYSSRSRADGRDAIQLGRQARSTRAKGRAKRTRTLFDCKF